MKVVVGMSLGVMVAGPLGGIAGAVMPLLWGRITRERVVETPLTLVLLLLLVELRSGVSVLAALVAVSKELPAHKSLRAVSRVALVGGLVAALPHADDQLRPVVAQLARAQRSGASLSGSVRRMLETELANERTHDIAKARTLPVRLMIPVTLLMLPGLVLLLYAPSLLGMFEELTGALR